MADGLIQMQRAIIDYIKSNTKKEKNINTMNTGALKGTYNNGKVLVGNKSYYADLAIDMSIQNGDSVWCLIANDNSTAAIVGM